MRNAAFWLIILSRISLGATGGEIEAGPENHGLQLRFGITNGENDTRSFTLELRNKRKEAVELSTAWGYESDTGDFSEFVKKRVTFSTMPEVRWFPPQTFVGGKKPPQAVQRVEVGGRFVVSWTTNGPLLKEKKDAGVQSFASFPPGLYFVRAHLWVRQKEDYVELWSNEQPFIVGGKQTAPKAPIGSITRVDAEKKTARLDIGSGAHVAPGDEYYIPVMASPTWKLKVTAVDSTSAEATLIEARSLTFPDWKPDLPKLGTQVVWMPTAAEK